MTPSTDFSTLGRLGSRAGRRPQRRRPVRRARPVHRPPAPVARVPWPRITAVLAVVIALLALVAVLIGGQGSALPTHAAAALQMDPGLERALQGGADEVVPTGAIALVPGGGAAAVTTQAPTAFAAVDDIALFLPVPPGEGVVFLEADNPAAVPLVPVGQMARNGNPSGFTPPTPLDGPAFSVAEPRSGVRPATGMAAILGAPAASVAAPVQGVVTVVEEFVDEAGATDVKVGIQPDGRPDLQVVVRRIEAPAVRVGDPVVAGQTTIGSLRDGAVVQGEDNPLGLPAVVVHVRPATLQD